MSDLVRVRVNGIESNVGRAYATAKGLEVIDAPTHTRSGRAVGPTRSGRDFKPKKSVDALASEKATKAPAATATEKAATPADSTTIPPSKEN